MSEFLLCAAFPMCQILALVALGLLLRVDRKPKGGA